MVARFDAALGGKKEDREQSQDDKLLQTDFRAALHFQPDDKNHEGHYQSAARGQAFH